MAGRAQPRTQVSANHSSPASLLPASETVDLELRAAFLHVRYLGCLQHERTWLPLENGGHELKGDYQMKLDDRPEVAICIIQ